MTFPLIPRRTWSVIEANFSWHEVMSTYDTEQEAESVAFAHNVERWRKVRARVYFGFGFYRFVKPTWTWLGMVIYL